MDPAESDWDGLGWAGLYRWAGYLSRLTLLWRQSGLAVRYRWCLLIHFVFLRLWSDVPAAAPASVRAPAHSRALARLILYSPYLKSLTWSGCGPGRLGSSWRLKAHSRRLECLFFVVANFCGASCLPFILWPIIIFIITVSVKVLWGYVDVCKEHAFVLLVLSKLWW